MLSLKSGEGAGTSTCGMAWTTGKEVDLGWGSSDGADTFGVDGNFGVGVCFVVGVCFEAGVCFELGVCFGVGGGCFSAFTGCGI